MKALIYEKCGEPIDVIKLRELPIPKPAPDQVLLKIKTMTLNPSDLAMIRGVYKAKQKLPNAPGIEGIGEVIAVGSQIKSLQPGMLVIKTPESTTELVVGTWQEYICVPESHVVILPAHSDPLQMTQLFSTISSAWIITVNELNLKPGQTLLLTAAGSTVGRLILQLSKYRGFSVIAVVRRPEQVAEMKALGAQEVICSTTEDVGNKALAYTKLKGVDAALDCVGGDMSTHCLKALAEQGKMIIFGLLENKIQVNFDIRKLLFSNITVRGFWLNGWLQNSDYHQRTIVVNKCIDLIEKGIITADIEKEYKIEDFVEALKHVERPGNSGRVIISL